MSLLIEELMCDRYKVVNDYPRCPFGIGDILTKKLYDNKNYFFESQSGVFVQRYVVEPYPHLFRKLEWFEDRDFDLTGMYVRFGSLDKAHAYYKLIAKFEFPSEAFWKMEGKFGEHGFPLNDSFPATLEEYNAFKSGKS